MNAIEIEGVSLERRIAEESDFDLKRQVFALLQRRARRGGRRTVLRDVSLTVARGEKLGIVGANGSGKSTLLKVICGILQPTGGAVRTRGAIAPLLELGAGFDADLSVHDNVLLYGLLLGHSRAEMRANIARILDFAELEEYRHAPLRNLSSGMTARLGFAIATDSHPDILILDEVMAVGDERFRIKSRRRIESLWRDHVTVLLVSHELGFVKEACTSAVWLDQGTIRMDGPAGDVVAAYLESVEWSAIDRLAQARATLRELQ